MLAFSSLKQEAASSYVHSDGDRVFKRVFETSTLARLQNPQAGRNEASIFV